MNSSAGIKLAVIPARGGSKRIPRKNIRDFCGKPVIAYSIEAAIATELLDNIIVSTDDDEIAEVARAYGAETPFTRPDELSDDFSGTNAVIKHAIEWYQSQGIEVDIACCIYATAPFIQVEYLQQAYQRLMSGDAAFAFSVTGFDFPIQRALRMNADNRLEPVQPESIDARSQDLEECYHDAGQFYWGRAAAFTQELTMMSDNSSGVILPRYLVQDIDTEEDWRQAELMFQSLAAR